MNTLRFSILALIFTAFLSISALAQAQSQGRSVYVNTGTFYDEKAGIIKLVNANKQVEGEFTERIKELQDGNPRLQAMAKELENMTKLPPAQFNQAAYAAKKDEAERLQRDLNYKKVDLEAAVAKRRDQVIGPIILDVGKAIDEFGAKNAYTAILDLSKMYEAGALLFLAPSSDVTKEFILFYNTRPATASAPK